MLNNLNILAPIFTMMNLAQADDNTTYTIDVSLDTLMTKFECAANTAIDWFHYNGMKLNSSKCHLLI